MDFNTFYAANPTYEDNLGTESTTHIIPTRAGTQTIQNERWLVFNAHPNDDHMVVGTEYMIVIKEVVQGDKTDEAFQAENPDLAALYGLGDEVCSKIGEFTVHSSGVVRIDGKAQPDLDNLNICTTQKSTISMDIWGIQIPDHKADGHEQKLVLLQDEAVLDWFDGSMDELGSTKRIIDGKERTLLEVLNEFRNEHLEATTWDVAPRGRFTQQMKDWLKELCARDPLTGRPKLFINQKEYVIPPIENIYLNIHEKIYVTAIPINRFNQPNVLFCTDPEEVVIHLRDYAPNLKQGFSELNYPASKDDVSLRIGYDQLLEASAPKEDIPTSTHKITIPIRDLTPTTPGVDNFILTDDKTVYLAQTNDRDKVGSQELGLIPIGEIRYFYANTDDLENSYMEITFDEGFRFREGYFYTIRFNYREDYSGLDAGEEFNAACDGNHWFTIKVVPKYQIWDGAQNRNWANDDNWRRQPAAELYADHSAAIDPYVTNGDNKTRQSFVPMDFTCVTVTDTATVAGATSRSHIATPRLFDIAPKSQAISYRPDPAAAATLRAVVPMFYQDVDTDGNVTDDEALKAEMGEVTDGIQFEMAATTLKGKEGVYVKPFYTHTADQVHVNTGGEIIGQQHLAYNKAWVDLELPPHRWLAVSSPLSQTYAGDFYLPTADARQTTELFQPISYDKDKNNRFAPAVYQRSWNRSGQATVHKLDATTKDAAVTAWWSKVYNEVTESYSAGSTFAIKAELSGVAKRPDRVLFRLPKADTRYDYLEPDNKNNTGTYANIDRTSSHRFTFTGDDITTRVEAREASNYFMIGNPFMAHIDMREFFEKNKALEHKFWYPTEAGYVGVLYDDTKGSFYTVAADGTTKVARKGYVAPLTGVFVKQAGDPMGSIDVTFTGSMVVTDDLKGLKGADMPSAPGSRGSDGGMLTTGMLTISGYIDGATAAASRAAVRVDDQASAAFVEGEDLELLDDPAAASASTLYTLADGLAMTLNSVAPGTTIPLGVRAKDPATITDLTFNGTDAMTDYWLYDAETLERTPLYEGMRLRIEGSSFGRYFLTASIAETIDPLISIEAEGRTVTVTAPGCGELRVSVADLAGVVILGVDEEADTASFDLTPGFYIISAERDGNRAVSKLYVR